MAVHDKIDNPDEKEDIDKEVEDEDLGQSRISHPYDPDKIRIDHQNVNLGTVLEMLEFNEIDLMPDFQRQSDLWSKVQQSRLIESVLLGLPLPSFYFNVDKATNKWQVVDGLQRLSTFKNFWVDKTLQLQGLEFLEGYEGKGFDGLNRADYRKISGFKVNLYVIDKDTPKQVKFLIFKRVNTGGLVLKPQEMRHALNQGVPAQFIAKLANAKAFKQATDYRISSERQEDRDFVNRFVAFYIKGFDTNYEGELDSFLNDGMSELDNLSEGELANLEADFTESMTTCYEIFSNDCFRKRYDVADKRKPISKAVFDTLSVNVANLNSKQRSILIENKEPFKYGMFKLFGSKPFDEAISFGTGQKSKVKYRFEQVKELIEKTIKK